MATQAPEAATAAFPTGFDDLSRVAPEWRHSMQAANRAPRTISLYLSVLGEFERYLAAQGMPRSVTAIHREHVESYIRSLQDRRLADATVSLRWRALQSFWTWAVRTEEVERSPMAKMDRPAIPDQDAVDIPSLDDVRAVLKACQGTTFTDRRDTAVILLLLDTGGRLAEVARLAVDDIDWDARTISVLAKGRKSHRYLFGDRTAKALRAYLRVRNQYPKGHLAALWIGPKGAMTPSGVYQIVRDRSIQARLAKPLHPHQFRHLKVHLHLAQGGNESDLARLMNWTPSSAAKLTARYGAALSKERAEAAYRKIGAPSDTVL